MPARGEAATLTFEFAERVCIEYIALTNLRDVAKMKPCSSLRDVAKMKPGSSLRDVAKMKPCSSMGHGHGAWS